MPVLFHRRELAERHRSGVSRERGHGAAQSKTPILEISSIRKDYRQPDGSSITALRLDSLAAYPGDAISVTGPSGSGKTTLLRILAAIIRPTSGSVRFAGQDIMTLGKAEDKWRSLSVGYVFQEINLLPDFSVLENLMLASEISDVPHGAARTRALKLIDRLGLGNRKHSRPRNLSLGERQRAAVARAVIHEPPMILADEPTASLDAASGRAVLRLLMELCAERRSLLITATHDDAVKRAFHILGVSRESLAAISWLEGVILLTAGVILGWLLGRAGVYAVFSFLGGATAIEPAIPFGIGEISISAALLASGALSTLVIALNDSRGHDTL